MRDPDRIEKTLNEIKEIWKHYPDFRLCQLIGNVVRDPAAYYVEDDTLIKLLKHHYGFEEEAK